MNSMRTGCRHRVAAVLGAVCLLAPVPVAYADADLASRTALSRAAIQSLAGALREQLSAAFAESGAAAAIQVCNLTAPALTEAVSSDHGWKIGRTSLKVRNPDNSPDAWERSVLRMFEARKGQGADPAMLDHAEVVVRDGRRSFRYMKAIVTGKPCIVCHGSDLAPDVRAQLDDLYPGDQARGYAPGDLRGGFTITQPLDEG